MKAPSKTLILVAVLAAILIGGILVYVYFFPPKKLRIGFLQGDLHQLAFFVAKEKGFFAKEGIDFDYIAYENGVKEMDAFKAGAIDIGYLGMAPATLKRIEAKINITIIAGANAEGSAIIAGTESGISSVRDLRGKNVAIPGFGTVQDILLRVALDQHGLNYTDLSGGAPTVTGPWNMPGLLDDGSIHAYIAWEPYCARSVYEGYGHAITNGTSHEIWPLHPCCVLAVRTDFLEKNLELVKKIVKVHINATRWIINNVSEAISIAKKWTGLSDEVINLAMDNIIFLYEPSPEGVRRYLQYLIQFGYVKEVPGGIDNFIQQFVNTQIVKEVE